MTDTTETDFRFALVLVEPIFGDPCTGDASWHGMAFAGGKVVNDIVGPNRLGVFDDCLSALAAAGIDVEIDQMTDAEYDERDGHA